MLNLFQDGKVAHVRNQSKIHGKSLLNEIRKVLETYQTWFKGSIDLQSSEFI